MKLFTKHSDYAVRALAMLAREKLKGDRLLSSRQISAREYIPLRFLRRLLQVLVKNKLVLSREGAAGGLCLAIAPKKISVARIMRLIQGEICISECMFRKKICTNRSKCVLRKKIKKIEAKLIKEFEAITIADLIEVGGEK